MGGDRVNGNGNGSRQVPAWALVAALGLVLGTAVATLALVPPTARPTLIRELPETIATIMAIGAAWWSRRAASMVGQVANGEFEARVTRAVTTAMARERGTSGLSGP